MIEVKRIAVLHHVARPIFLRFSSRSFLSCDTHGGILLSSCVARRRTGHNEETILNRIMELLPGTDRLREHAAALELFNNTVSDGVKILRSGKDQIGVGW